MIAIATRGGPRRGLAALLCLLLAACATSDISPVNGPLLPAVTTTPATLSPGPLPPDADTGIVLAFSGGGARSAAFGYGALTALAERPSGHRGRSLADDVLVVSGVSGGAILASYYALNGPAGLETFRRAFLDQDVEAALRTSLTPVNLLRAYQGGVNDLTGLPAWLDANLFHGATFGDLRRASRPRLIVHATDLYNRAPFVFDQPSFAALCSNLDGFPLSHAVAASAAVPVVFSPIVLRNFNTACPVGPAAQWRQLSPARSIDPALTERDYQAALVRYRTAPDLNFLKLYDGGLVDGLGTQSLIHLMRRGAPEPLSAAQAERLRRVVFIVVDASTRIGGDMSRTAAGPNAIDAIVGATDAMIDSASRHSVDALTLQAKAWRDKLVRWRCARPQHLADCASFDVEVIRIALADVTDHSRRQRILALHNKLTLRPDDVGLVAGLGRRLLTGDPTFQRVFAGRPRLPRGPAMARR
ncbi:patatin-like phospholipase family protein [Phreatobacter stygius]|uniref:patatin-like phospholipase family protein n=1 Tax=Phreatobacter stygius TaxID=1940610 RepID=UPI001476C7FC|nr:patatin-like phospholipase family protein [Phreatobacter stygius]